MPYHCSFVDNVLYGPEDVNEVVADLVGAGVAPFISKDSYTPEDLNSLTAAVVSSGTQLEGCKVSRVSETVVSVAPGIIYFGNGLRLKVTEAHSIIVPENQAVIIYASFDDSTGIAELTYSTLTITKSDNNIPLATISADGTITDVRVFAESKVATLGSNAVYTIPSNKISYYSFDTVPNYKNYRLICKIDLNDINIERYNYLNYLGYSSDYDFELENLYDLKKSEEKNLFANSFASILRDANNIIFIWKRTDDYQYNKTLTFIKYGINSMKLL